MGGKSDWGHGIKREAKNHQETGEIDTTLLLPLAVEKGLWFKHCVQTNKHLVGRERETVWERVRGGDLGGLQEAFCKEEDH